MNAIGENIKKLRKQKGWTQTELAQKSGATQQLITMYERNIQKPSIERLPKIANAFGISIDELLGLQPPRQLTEEPHTHQNTRIAQMQKLFDKLSPTEQRSILKQVRALLKQSNTE